MVRQKERRGHGLNASISPLVQLFLALTASHSARELSVSLAPLSKQVVTARRFVLASCKVLKVVTFSPLFTRCSQGASCSQDLVARRREYLCLGGLLSSGMSIHQLHSSSLSKKQQQLLKKPKMSPTTKSKASSEAEPSTAPQEWSTSSSQDSAWSQRWSRNRRHGRRWQHHTPLHRRTRLGALREAADGGWRESEPPRPERQLRGTTHGGGVREARCGKGSPRSRHRSRGGGIRERPNYLGGVHDSPKLQITIPTVVFNMIWSKKKHYSGYKYNTCP
ncbi:hypothetical protein JHK87_001734 [Glycine soja]|nr:hypothetical protein JHK87_001734 [Glycine soja]